jgi:hypothetical protein
VSIVCPAIVRSADDLSPIVQKKDELVRTADDRSQIVRHPDDYRRGPHTHVPGAMPLASRIIVRDRFSERRRVPPEG